MKIVYLTICIFIVSCGADQFKNGSKASSSSVTSSSVSSCLCTSDYSPVCGLTDKKSYENACLAKCFGNTSSTPGNCQCRTDIYVCGSDNITYTECDAKKANVSISKYVACDATEL